MTEPTFVQRTKRLFFATAIADICRAIEGRSLVGAFTLGMCTVGALSYLHYDAIDDKEPAADLNRRQKFINMVCRLLQIQELQPRAGVGDAKLFCVWVKKFLGPTNKIYKKVERKLYGIRCGLVHVFGMSNALADMDVQGYQLTHRLKDQHWIEIESPTASTERAYRLNLESFVAELIIAAYSFFDNLDERYENLKAPRDDSFLARRLSNLLCLFMVEVSSNTPSPCTPPSSYSEIHHSLKPLDQTWPNEQDLLKELTKSIESLYDKPMALWFSEPPLSGLSTVLLTQAATGCSSSYANWSNVQTAPTIPLDPTA